MKETFYLTTPIYFPSDKLHIGHAYTTVAADTIARYKKMRGYDVFFLTGTDEHGQKIERIATERGMEPKAYVDEVVLWIKDLWKTMDIDYDDYIRTTDPRHEQTVQKIFKKLYDKGDIYKSEYEGKYCTPCETFFTETQLKDGKCPDCGREVELVKEESYFFRLSAYTDKLLQLLEDQPDFIQPESRKNEMINNFLKPGLEDLAVSRTSFKWGIPVEFDPGHVIYVWVDALSNYITALGYLSEDDSLYQKYWPANVHLMAKEIVRFHSIIWPAMLMALEIPLPKQIFGHGWIVIDGGKMSKSKGTVVDPKVLVDRYSVDSIRYFLLRETPFGQDSNFSNEILINRINSDLANDLGNLVSRTAGMIEKYFGGNLPDYGTAATDFDDAVIALAGTTVEKAEAAMDHYHFSDALIAIWELVGRLNKYIDETQPWVLAKDDANKDVLARVLYMLAEGIRVVSVLIAPFMPNTPGKIYEQLLITDDALKTWDSTKQWGLLPHEFSVKKQEAIFPRIDVKKELEELAAELKQAQAETVRESTEGANLKENQLPENQITIDDFCKVELKMGEIIACEKLAGSKKLLKSQVRIGDEVRQILSGIAKYYTPEQMVGKKVVVATNLKAAKLAGEMSYGMILAASDEEGNLALLTSDNPIKDGSVIS